MNRFFRFLFLSVLLLVVIASSVFFAFYFYYKLQLPDLRELHDYRSRARQTIKLYARSGELIHREVFGARRTIAELERIPRHMRQAMLAAEDKNFYEHDGIDLLGVARAAVKIAFAGRFTHGGSTITQQLAKTFFLSREKTLQRKWKELILAKEIELRFEKDEILFLYMNQIYFGSGAYGVEEAAQSYFGRGVDQVTLSQAATLAGLVRSPSRYSPLDNPDFAMVRRNEVLSNMLKNRWISIEEYETAVNEPLGVVPTPYPYLGVAPHFCREVLIIVQALLKNRDLRALGLSIYTTLDIEAHSQAMDSLPKALNDIDSALYSVRTLRTKPEISLKNEFPAQVTAFDPDAVTMSVRLEDGREVDLGARELSRYKELLIDYADRVLIDGWVTVTELPDPGAKPPRSRWAVELGPQIATVALDAKDGAVISMLGGDDFGLHPFNRAVYARRPIGSTIKPFLVAIGLRDGAFEIDTTFENRKLSFKGAGGKEWTPRNYSVGYDGKSYSVADALVHSINTIAIRMLQLVGVDEVVAELKKAGFDEPLPKDLSLALGSNSESLFGLVSLYGVFANEGLLVRPYLVERIVDRNGASLYVTTVEEREVFPAKVATEVRHVLERVVSEGTGRRAEIGTHTVGGKTGTTNGGRNSWFIGTCDHIAGGVWIGFDDNRRIEGATGGSLAAPAWRQLIAPACP